MAIVGEEPLLEAVFDTNGLPAVVLYGQPGPDYHIGAKTELDELWTPEGCLELWAGELDDLFR